RAQRGFAARSEGDRGSRAAASRTPSSSLHPFIAGAGLLLAGVMALGATLIVERHERRNHRPAPAPEAREPEPLPLPKPRAVAQAPARATPPAPEAPPGGA